MNKKTKLLLEGAEAFGRKAHAGQTRKYSGGDYFEEHCLPVSTLVWEYTERADITAAAMLHDVIEDTDVGYLEISVYFGLPIANMVWGMTQVSKPEDGNRKKRKAKDRDFLAMQSGDVQTIKCADLLCNTWDIVQQDPEFAKVYMVEAEQLVHVLTKAEHALWSQLYNQVTDYFCNKKLEDS